MNHFLPPAGFGCSVCNYSMWTVGFISLVKSAAFVTSCSGIALLSTLWSWESRSRLVEHPRFGLKIQFSDCWMRFPLSKTPGRGRITSWPFCNWIPFPSLVSPPLSTTPLPCPLCLQAEKIGCVIICTRVGPAGMGSWNHTDGLWSRISHHPQPLSTAVLCGQPSPFLAPSRAPPKVSQVGFAACLAF